MLWVFPTKPRILPTETMHFSLPQKRQKHLVPGTSSFNQAATLLLAGEEGVARTEGTGRRQTPWWLAFFSFAKDYGRPWEFWKGVQEHFLSSKEHFLSSKKVHFTKLGNTVFFSFLDSHRNLFIHISKRSNPFSEKRTLTNHYHFQKKKKTKNNHPKKNTFETPYIFVGRYFSPPFLVQIAGGEASLLTISWCHVPPGAPHLPGGLCAVCSLSGGFFFFGGGQKKMEKDEKFDILPSVFQIPGVLQITRGLHRLKPFFIQFFYMSRPNESQTESLNLQKGRSSPRGLQQPWPACPCQWVPSSPQCS